MWFIECDGPQVFDNKRIWLRPGTQFLLGRTRPKPGSPGQYIEHGSVSRKHLLVTVDPVKPGDSAHLHAKSTLTVTDSSKIGTTVDSKQLQKAAKVLDKDEHTLQLGNFNDLFHIKWVPMTFSFPPQTKKKAAGDKIAEFRAILEPLDIKCAEEYLARHTSHTVSVKRNTALVLQALVNGRHIVMESYLQQVAAAGKKTSSDEQSPLEVDFDANWPRELDFLPPPGKEPNPRPAFSEQFLSNKARSEMFAKYTFVFHDQGQYDSLMPVITGGGGKVLLRQVQPGETDVQGMVEFIREVAGKKGDTSFDLSQQIEKTTAGGIVVLRIASSDAQVPGFYDELDLALRQRSIEQNEFLDAILDVDAAKLKQAVDVAALQSSVRVPEQPHDRRDPLQQASMEPSTAQRAQQSPERTSAVQSQQEPEPEPLRGPAARRRAARQRTTQPTYRGFDDFKPEEMFSKWEQAPSSPPGSIPEPSQALSADPIDAEYSIPSQSQRPGAESSSTMRSQTQQSSRKRPGEPLEEMETTKDVVDGILKGATAMKKRKLEEDRQNAASRAAADDEDVEMREEAPAQPGKKQSSRPRKEKEMDVKALLVERRQAQDEALQRDEEVLSAQFDGMDVADIRNLAVIEEMDVMRKDPPPRALHNDDGPSDRWNDRWNGRKNFKKFRRQGTAGSTYERARTRVIVPLEEVQRKAYGVGEDYWLEPVEDTRRKEKEKRLTQQSQLRNTQTNGSTRKSQSQRNGRGRDSGASSATLAAGLEDDDGGMGTVHDEDDDDDDDDDDTRFRRRIRNSRIHDAETAETEDFYPEEIAGKPRDAGIEAAANEHEPAVARKSKASNSRASTQTQTQTQGRKRGAASESASAPAAKRARNGGSSRAGAIVVDEGDSDEEDALRFRRRTRK